MLPEPTWVCRRWRWLCAPEGETQTLGEGDGDSRRRIDTQSPHVPDGNLMAYTALSPVGKRERHWCGYIISNTYGVFPLRLGWKKPTSSNAVFLKWHHHHLTSVPEPGRKFLTVIVLPGAGKGASIMPLIKGCTRAGEMALLFSTSSRIWETQRGKTF